MSTWTRRRALAAGAAGCLVVAIVMGGASAATAADGPWDVTGTAGTGTIPDAGVANNLDDAEGNVKELGPLNSNTTKIGVIHNDAAPTLGFTNPNAQVDLRQAWLDIKREGGKDWLYFAWERDNNTGSGFIAYEFMRNAAPVACGTYDTTTQALTDQLIASCNPWANRQGGAPASGVNPAVPGDFMILWDQQGSGLDLYLRIWSGTAPNLVLGAPIALNAATSQAAISADGFRGEAAVNLTDTIFGGALQCLSFANTIPSTVTGNSDTADYKDTILQTIPPISNCSTTTTTTPQTGAGVDIVPADGISIGTGVASVKDSAYVTLVGATSGTPGGTVAFSLCKQDTGSCTTGGTPVGSTAVTATAYPFTVVSPTAYVTSAGRYCWRAVYDDGNANNGIGNSSDSSIGECFTVNPVTPTLSTTAGAGGNLGGTVSDSATLGGTATQPASPVINLTGTGGAAAGGTITFKLYGPNNCTTLAYTSPTVAVSGNSTYNTPAPQFQPTLAGTYHWVAEYSGNLPNTNAKTHNAACTDSNEDVTMTSVPSTLTSAQRWVPNDSVTITAPAGTGNLAGTVSFELFANNTCTGTALYSLTNAAVTGASPQTVSTANTTTAVVTATGSYWWKVSYTSTNPAQRSIQASCNETTALTIGNGPSVSSQ